MERMASDGGKCSVEMVAGNVFKLGKQSHKDRQNGETTLQIIIPSGLAEKSQMKFSLNNFGPDYNKITVLLPYDHVSGSSMYYSRPGKIKGGNQ